jgi:hypothetical protein
VVEGLDAEEALVAKGDDQRCEGTRLVGQFHCSNVDGDAYDFTAGCPHALSVVRRG